MNCAFLSFGVPAKPGIANILLRLMTLADCIEPLLVKKICLSQPHKMLQANKVLRFARSNKKILSNLQNINSQQLLGLKGASLVSMTSFYWTYC